MSGEGRKEDGERRVAAEGREERGESVPCPVLM
jgi:hypothetical protein